MKIYVQRLAASLALAIALLGLGFLAFHVAAAPTLLGVSGQTASSPVLKTHCRSLRAEQSNLLSVWEIASSHPSTPLRSAQDAPRNDLRDGVQGGEAAAPGKLVVAVAPGTARGALDALLVRSSAILDRWLPDLGLALVSAPDGKTQALATALWAEPVVEFVAPHYPSAAIADVPPDQYFGQQWGMTQTQATLAWDLAVGDASVPIAIVDTGVNYLHQDLRDRIWYNPRETVIDPLTGRRLCDNNGLDDDENGLVDDCRGWDFVDRDRDPDDGHGHGTFVAGIAVATAGNWDPVAGVYAGVAGMARQGSVMALRSLDNTGAGTAFDIADAIVYAVNQGARVVNLSLTLNTPEPDPYTLEVYRRAVEYAQVHDVLVVGASGNLNYQSVFYPARFPGVLAVGASTQTDARAFFSNYGPRLDIVAPGVGIFSTLRGPGENAYGLISGAGNGTSYAAPHAAGVAALVRGLRPDLDHVAVNDLLRRTADDVGDPGFDAQTGWGRLNAYRAVSEAVAGLALSLVADPPTIAVGSEATMRLQVSVAGPEVRGQGAGGWGGGAGARGQASVVGHAPSAGFGARVGFVASNGTITPTVVTVNALGRATPRFVAGAIAGTVWITASLGGVSVSAALTVTSGQPASIEMTAVPDRIASGGGQAVITAIVRDEGGSAALHGIPVAFTTTLGSVNPMTATTSAGRAATVLTSGPISGTAHVQAAVGGVSMTIPVQIVGAGQPYSIVVTAQPATLIVAGAPATVTATVFDGLGQRVADGTSVQFAADRGTVTPAQATTSGGQASTQFAAGTLPGQGRVTATADGVRGEAQLLIYPGPALTVTLAASPQELIAGYGQTAMLRATASDRFGNLVADGTRLDFIASLGQASPGWVTTTNGAAEAHFVGGLVAGTSTITVTAAGGAWGQAQVRIWPAAAASLTLHITPTAISVGGEAAALWATLRDQFGNAVADGAAVEFMTDLGSLRGAAAREHVAQAGSLRYTQAITLAVTTTGGVATAELISGEVPGVARVRAASGPNLVQTGAVIIQPGAPAALSLAIEPAQVPVGGRAVITATVRDRFANSVADGITVRFRASRGQLTASQAATRDSQATTTLIAPRQLGPISVFVETAAGSAAAFGEVEVIPARVYLPTATR